MIWNREGKIWYSKETIDEIILSLKTLGPEGTKSLREVLKVIEEEENNV